MKQTMIFDFEGKQVKEIPFNALEQSLRVLEATGKFPKNRPVEAVDFINDIKRICENKRVICNLEPIFVDKSGSRMIVRRGDNYEKFDARTWLFEKLITKISIHDSHPEYNPSIALTYNERGLALAYGTNVRICSNMSILNSQNYISTWGNEKMTYEHILELVQSWVERLESLKEEEYATLEAMKNIHIDPVTGLDVLVGKLYRHAVRGTYLNEDKAPLNMTQMSLFVQGLEKKNYVLTNDSTVYDIYNIGTSIISPSNNDFTTIWGRNANWGEFIKAEYLS